MPIRFSHKYPKLNDQTAARLIHLEIRDRKELCPEFIEYDTRYDGGNYPLPDTKLIVLIFLGNKMIPFTTVRPHNYEKERYYRSRIGLIFTIEHVTAGKAPVSQKADQTTNEPPNLLNLPA